jgi:hypothetical protein
MRRHASYLSIIPSALVISFSAGAQTSGTLTAQVNVPGGSASGLVVTAALSIPDTAAGYSSQRAYASVTNSAGQVSFTGLPLGIYSVCVEPRNGILVEPCRWLPPQTIHLTSQSPSGSISLTAQRGIPVNVRIDDPEGLLGSPGGNGLSVGVVTPLGPVQLRPSAQDSTGVNYQIIAPPSVAAFIQIFTGAWRIVDGTGATLNLSSATTAPAASSFNPGTASTGQFFRYTLRKNQ